MTGALGSTWGQKVQGKQQSYASLAVPLPDDLTLSMCHPDGLDPTHIRFSGQPRGLVYYAA